MNTLIYARVYCILVNTGYWCIHVVHNFSCSSAFRDARVGQGLGSCLGTGVRDSVRLNVHI